MLFLLEEKIGIKGLCAMSFTQMILLKPSLTPGPMFIGQSCPLIVLTVEVYAALLTIAHTAFQVKVRNF